ncbi:threonine ammonia-lyase IlvA [Ornithinimicrobium cryptoxanthini]|uniref:L-threonine dehydratase n=1 Tax=Ornithinimicrobium cryptoxanthini TaxID=2934161 RepID=A0ABY4YHH2_9MICO|nr:threonine ammonia-lyase IlvA [Ornithinimicrobium cryptoxanthini]USQ76226.1 threonine ammonia-lyase IlvA [Ornithinimicrobium cryptoxanthini]
MTNSAPTDRLNAGARVTAADVDAAAARVQGLVSITPLTRSRRLSEATGAKVLLKREDQQPVRSYKNRGAINLISQLDPADHHKGVVAASAGNHAQGVAFACASLEVPARIFLPRTTPRQKRDRVAAIGGELVEIVVTGSTYDAAAAAAAEDAERTGATLVPAFDHPMTIAGQGTVTREIVGVLGHAPDVLVMPVGGGGLLAGGLAWLREHDQDARVVGVEPAGAAGMARALSAGGPVTLEQIDPFVDGAAVRRVGDHTFPIVRDGRAELVSVAEGAVCVEMLALYQTEGIITEPAGALAAAALPDLGIQPGQTVVVVVSGGNNDVLRYAEVAERALVHEGRKHYFLVDFPQEPGALRGFLHDVLGPDDDIALFEYTKRNNRETGPALVGIELGSREDLQPLLDRMEASPIEVEPIPPDSPLFRFIL